MKFDCAVVHRRHTFHWKRMQRQVRVLENFVLNLQSFSALFCLYFLVLLSINQLLRAIFKAFFKGNECKAVLSSEEIRLIFLVNERDAPRIIGAHGITKKRIQECSKCTILVSDLKLERTVFKKLS